MLRLHSGESGVQIWSLRYLVSIEFMVSFQSKNIHSLNHTLSFSDMGWSPPVTFAKSSSGALKSMTWKCSRAWTLLRQAQFLNHTTCSLGTAPAVSSQKVLFTKFSSIILECCVKSPVAGSSAIRNFVHTTICVISGLIAYGQSLNRTL